MYSVTAENSRDARQGEDLVITRAPHGSSNWLTETVAVQLPQESVRGASFEPAPVPDERGHRDFLKYFDGEKERVALSALPLTTKIRVLSVFANGVPEVIPTPLEQEDEKELVGEGASGAGRRRPFSRLFGFYPVARDV